VALCCHHRCTWQSYVGKEFIKNCGLSPGEFTLLCKLSGWTAATWTGWRTKEEMNRDTSQGQSSTPGGQEHSDEMNREINQGQSSTPGGQEHSDEINRETSQEQSSTPRGQGSSVRNVEDKLLSDTKDTREDESTVDMEDHRDQDQPFSK
jgi:hypothetical protein